MTEGTQKVFKTFNKLSNDEKMELITAVIKTLSATELAAISVAINEEAVKAYGDFEKAFNIVRKATTSSSFINTKNSSNKSKSSSGESKFSADMFTDSSNVSKSNKNKDKKKKEYSHEKVLWSSTSSMVKSGKIIKEDDCVLRYSKNSKHKGTIGGQLLYNHEVYNFYYGQYTDLFMVFSPCMDKDEVNYLKEMVKKNIPDGWYKPDVLPACHPDVPGNLDRFYWDEIEEGNFIYSNPDGSFIGYCEEYAFVIFENEESKTDVFVCLYDYYFNADWNRAVKRLHEIRVKILGIRKRFLALDPPTKAKTTKEDKSNKDNFKNKTKNSSEVIDEGYDEFLGTIGFK